MSSPNEIYLNEWKSCVSRETLDRLIVYHDLLLRWQGIKNLVAKSTLGEIWERHFADSAQLLDFAGDVSTWVDIGSGGGFPGMIVAIMLGERNPAAKVALIESDHRKSAFLRVVSRETGVAAEIRCGRVEKLIQDYIGWEVVSARALAPMSKLVEYTLPMLEAGACGLFLKGQDIDGELTEIPISSRVYASLYPSRTDFKGRVVVVRHLDFLESSKEAGLEP